MLKTLKTVPDTNIIIAAQSKKPNLDKPEVNSDTYEFLCRKRNEIHC